MYKITLVIAAYIAAQIFADIASLKIALVFGLSMDAGTLVYPITFTLRDLVHKIIGAKSARVLIVAAAAINLIMALFFALVAALPGDEMAGSQDAFGNLLNPVWRIVIASIIAEVISELIDTEAYALWVRRFGERWQWGRVLLSNAVSVPLDSALFCMIAFWGEMPPDVIGQIFITNVVLKGIVTLVSIPMIYAVQRQDLELQAQS